MSGIAELPDIPVNISEINPEFELTISGKDGIILEMQPKEEIKLGFHVLRKANRSNLLVNRALVDEYDNRFI